MRFYSWHCYPVHACSVRSRSSDRHAPYSTRQHGSSRRGGGFGVRRPLRYLRYQLDLDESQTRRLAAVLNRLKLERDQGQIDEARSTQALADLVMHEKVLPEEVKAALAPRLKTAERLQAEIALSLAEICEILDADQRDVFADLLRDGAISL